MIPADVRQYINAAAKAAATETIEQFNKYGTLISRTDVIKEIGKPLYDDGVRSGRLHPTRRSDGVKGKFWIKTSEFIQYKNEIFNLN